MSAGAGKKIAFNSRWTIITVLGVILILAVAVAAVFFIRYRQAGNLRVAASSSQVIITQPGNLAEFPVGLPIQVGVAASGGQPFTSTELWINAVLEGVQAAPPGGLASLSSSFSWVPPATGNYSLVARAVDQQDHTVVSSAVIVFVTASDSGKQSSLETDNVEPVVFPSAPAGPWQGSPADWVTDLTAGSAPAAPKLVLAADGCNVKVQIHDLSDNEEGFALYRQTTNSPDWVHVKDLASHSGQGWIETQDANLSGGVTYYATAFNSQGETSSNLALVNFDPQACPAPQPAAPVPVLHLKVSNLSFGDAIDSLYCYNSLGGGQWARWPDLGFITPLEPGQEAPLLVNPLVLATLGDSGVDPGPQSLDLKIDCWGWHGGNLLWLGSFMDNLDLVHPQGIHAVFSGAAFDIVPDIFTGMKSEMFKLGVAFSGGVALTESPYTIDSLGYMPESDQMPRITAEVTHNINDCMDHVQDPASRDAACAPVPGFNAGPGGVDPQPYLVWDVYDTLCKAAGTKDCLSLNWWKGFAKTYPDPYDPGPAVHFIVDATFYVGEPNAYGDSWTTGEDQRVLRYTPDFPFGSPVCDHHGMILTVTLEVNTGLGHFRSAPSQWLQTSCPKPMGDSIQVEVNFEQMILGNMDEPANDAYGQFVARPNGQRSTNLLIGWWNGEEPIGDYGGSNGYIYKIGNGPYTLSLLKLCTDSGGSMCPFTPTNDYFTGNNKLLVTLRGGDALQLFSEFYDHNQYDSDDHICDGNVWVGPRTVEQWASTVNESVWLVQPGGHATCNLEVILSAIGPGQ